MGIKKHVKNVVGAGVIIGAGSIVLGGMGQGALIPKTTGKLATGLGTIATVGMAKGVLDIANKGTRRMSRKRRR